jgi:hypothetical protein
MKNLTRALQELVEWHPVGVALEIPHHKLDAIRISQHSIPLCKIALIDVWLRTDLAASWGKLVLALEEAGETTIAGRIKEERLGILASAPVPLSALVPPRIGSTLGPRGMPGLPSPLQPVQSVVGQQFQPVTHHQQYQPHNYQGGVANRHGVLGNHHGNGFIAADGPVQRPAVRPPAPVPSSAQPPVSSVTEALQLLKTNQERLISGLTRSQLNVNFTGGTAPGMTLLHYAAMQGANTECLKALIAFGADVNPINGLGLTPLDLAIMSHPAGGEMVDLLEAVGAVKGTDLTHGCQPVEEAHSIKRNGTHILSVPSSGPYCIVQLQILQQIEAQCRHKITTLFQWIVACGFGALFLLLVIYGNKAVSEVKRLYFRLREEVFSEPDMARRSQALDGFLQAHLGTQMKMSDLQQPRILIGALYKGSTKVEIRLFNNCLNDEYSDCKIIYSSHSSKQWCGGTYACIYIHIVFS